MSARDARVDDRKHCAACGRTIVWQRRWAKTWHQLRYCSQACRGRRLRAVDRALEAAIQSLLAARASGATICPSEAARAVAAGEAWRALMEPARRAARRLAHRGVIDITQRGRAVDPGEFRGPIRLRIRPRESRAR